MKKGFQTLAVLAFALGLYCLAPINNPPGGTGSTGPQGSPGVSGSPGPQGSPGPGITNAGTEGVVPVTGGSGNLIDSAIISGASDTSISSATINLNANVTTLGDVAAAGNRTKLQIKDSSGEFEFLTIAGGGLVFKLANLPTADPVVAGQIWNEGGFLKVSEGP